MRALVTRQIPLDRGAARTGHARARRRQDAGTRSRRRSRARGGGLRQRCAVCHAPNGVGIRRSLPDTDLGYVVPPLWGSDSFNDGAGMAR